MRRSGFTLIEMLVVLVIVVTLVAIAIGAFRETDSGLLNQAATLVQQKIMLAKSRATSDRIVRGIRFERDPNDNRVLTAMSLIGSSGYVTETLANFRSVSGSPATTGDDYWELTGAFSRLSDRGLISVGTHVEIPAESGNWYILSDKRFDPANGVLSIAGHYRASHWDDDPTQPQAGEYIVNHGWNKDPLLGPIGLTEHIQIRLELNPTTLSGDAPLALPRGTAIDIDASQVPDKWRTTTSTCDLLFDANGSTGSSTGLVHLYITRLQDIDLTRNKFPGHPANGGSDMPPIVPADPPSVPAESPYIVTVLKNTGMTFTSDADLTDTNGDGVADNPFLLARRGQSAN